MDKNTPVLVKAIPLEKQKITLAAVCLLLGCVAGMSMKVGIAAKTIDNMTDQLKGLQTTIEKRDADWRMEERTIYDRIGEIKVQQEIQAGQINELKMALDRVRR